MIAPNPMYLDQLRTTCKKTLAVVFIVALISAIIINQRGGNPAFAELFVYQLIVSFCVGALFWISNPVLRSYANRLRPGPRWAVRIVAAALTLNLGVSIGMAILVLLKVMPWSLYWVVTRESIVPTTVIGLACFVGFTMYETLKFRAQYETTQARLASLESRLRPHFLFNTLNSIMALIPEDPKAAERVTERLAALLRYSLYSTAQNTVPLEEEVKVTTDYLEIERTRFGDRLSYSIEVPERLMQVRVPPFSLQTLVENSVKYGGGEIRITAQNENGRLLLQVWDSGDGFPRNAHLPEGHGLRNLKDRLDVLWGSNAFVEFPNDGSGTTVQISLPAAPQ